MLTHEDNAILTEVEPGKPMHEMLKRYWIPAALSADFPEPDSDPVKITLLCETYVMFRDSAGRIGLLQEHCCHRGASLCLGRVEEGGVRCIYHGWKFDVDGAILDMPNATDERAKTRYRQPSYPTREAGGFIWAYLGPREKEPPFPRFPFFDVPESQRIVEVAVFDANFVQTIEGGIDSSHLGFLHRDTFSGTRGTPDAVQRAASRKLAINSTGLADPAQLAGLVYSQIGDKLAPRFEFVERDFGFQYAAVRDFEGRDGADLSLVRVTAYVMPFCAMIAANTAGFAVPVTSGRTHFFHVFWTDDEPLNEAAKDYVREIRGIGTDHMGAWGMSRATHDHPASANRENNFLQDRSKIRTGQSYTGIGSLLAEDAAITGSMGPIVDRTKTNLMQADQAVARLWRMLIDSAKRAGQGEDPHGVSPASAPSSAQGIVQRDQPWQSVLPNS